MKSCMNCKYAEETILESLKKCTNDKSVYYRKMVSKKDLCREGVESSWEAKNLER